MFSKINNLTYLTNEPLSLHSSFKIGGPAKHFVLAHTVDALLDALNICKQHSIQHKIIGNGSNLLFDDKGYYGAIIKYDNDFKQIKNNQLCASSGVDIASLIAYANQRNLSGFEFAVGIPAQLGGAIANNLGAYSCEISTYLEYVTVLRKNQILYLTKNECEFQYHKSIFQNNHDIILGATFNLPIQDKSISQNKILTYLSQRKTTQPLNLPNAGSIFRRDENIIPAKLIDQAGLKGLQIGNAQISTKHAGFIVNLGNATSKDVVKLIEIIKQKIFNKYNIELQLEIEYLPYK